MKTIDNTYALIHTLSKAEKQAASRFLKEREKDGKYLLLFRKLQSMPFYDENRLRRDLSRYPWKRQLPVMKTRLKQRILHCLAEKLEHVDIERRRLREMVQHIDAYRARGLYSQAERLIPKAMSLARDSEDFETLREVVDRHVSLLLQKHGADVHEELRAALAERRRCMKALVNIAEYRSLLDQIFLDSRADYTTERPDAVNAARDFLRHPLLEDESRAVTIESRRYYFAAKALCYRRLQDFEQVLIWRRRTTHLFEKNDHLRKIHRQDFIKAYGNYGDALLRARGPADAIADEFQSILKKIGSFKTVTEDDAAEQFQNEYHLRLWWHLQRGEFVECRSYIPHITKKLRLYAGKVNEARRFTFYYHIALVHFFSENCGEAAKFFGKIKDHFRRFRTLSRQDLVRASFVLHPLAEYDNGNPEAAARLHSAALRHVEVSDQSLEFEQKCLGYTLQLIEALPGEIRGLCVKWLKDLKELAAQPAGYAELVIWLHAKVTGEALQSVYRRRLLAGGRDYEY